MEEGDVSLSIRFVQYPAPCLWVNIRDALRKYPMMPARIFHAVLPLAEFIILWRVGYFCAVSFSLLVMCVNIVHANHNRVARVNERGIA